jgi:hypothetical protein
LRVHQEKLKHQVSREDDVDDTIDLPIGRGAWSVQDGYAGAPAAGGGRTTKRLSISSQLDGEERKETSKGVTRAVKMSASIVQTSHT